MYNLQTNSLSATLKSTIKKHAKILLNIIVSTIISTCISLLIHFDSLDSNLADLGVTKAQIIVADTARKNHNTPRALELYDKIKTKNNEYSFYAALIAGQIHEKEYGDYTQAWNNYKFAIGSDDIVILKECLRFAVDQNHMRYNNFSDNLINMEEKDNITILTDLFNKIYSIDPSISDLLNIQFPIDSEQTKKLLSPDMRWTRATGEWKYVSTITSRSSTKAYTTAKEKVILIDSWEELTDSVSFTTIRIYKYYKYQKKETSETYDLRDTLFPYVELEDSIYLSEITSN